MPKKQATKYIFIPDEILPRGNRRDELKILYAMSHDEALQEEFNYRRKNPKWAKEIDIFLRALSDGKIAVLLNEKKNLWDRFSRSPFQRWFHAQKLMQSYEHYKSTGDPQVILPALADCFAFDLPVPRWCEIAFVLACRDVNLFRAKSWDEAFGKPHAKQTKKDAAKDRIENELLVYCRVKEIKRHDPTRPIDRLLFEEIGTTFNISGSLAEKHYIRAKKALRPVEKIGPIVTLYESADGSIVPRTAEKKNQSHEHQ